MVNLSVGKAAALCIFSGFLRPNFFCGFSSAFVLDAFVWGSFTVSPRFSELVFVSVKFFPSGISCWSSNVVQATTLVALFRVGSGHHSYCLNSLWQRFFAVFAIEVVFLFVSFTQTTTTFFAGLL